MFVIRKNKVLLESLVKKNKIKKSIDTQREIIQEERKRNPKIAPFLAKGIRL